MVHTYKIRGACPAGKIEPLAIGLHGLCASGARRSRRFNVQTKGGLELACAWRGWTLKRAEARAPFREAARREHLPVMAEGIYGR